MKFCLAGAAERQVCDIRKKVIEAVALLSVLYRAGIKGQNESRGSRDQSLINEMQSQV